MELLIASIAGQAVSGVVGLPFSRRHSLGQYLSALVSVAAACAGLMAVANWFRGGASVWRHDWRLVPGSDFHIAMDGVSVVFLLPVLLLSLLGPIYGLGYWKQTEHVENGRKLRLFYGFCAAGMALLVVARNSVVFLFGWEVMAVSAYVLVATQDEKQAVREAAWYYLVATHTATLFLFGLFGALRAFSGSFDWPGVMNLTANQANAVFLLALVGFGFKAGIMPLHVWLPGAHANAPSHVSALMSGVLIKMGVYGLVRVSSFLPQPPLWWGGLLFIVGVLSGVFALAIGMAQSDVKRLLAYSSVENIGIIFIGLGAALLGRSLDRAEWVVLGLGGALWHVWNHALFKSLLFYCAGSLIHATQTRDINLLGGLAKRMPGTTFCFLIAAAAVCGLPPLNGFVSEFLIYLGLFSMIGLDHDFAGPILPAAALVAPGLALIGALALACYATAFGGIFLGAARSEQVQHAHESNWTMLGPMALLTAACITIGLLPRLVAPAFDRAIADWSHPGLAAGEFSGFASLNELGRLGWLTAIAFTLLALATAAAIALWASLRPATTSSSVTWGCGYSAPTPRMQYTATSFSEIMIGLFRWSVRPRVQEPAIRELFPQAATYHSDAPDSILHRLVLPACRWMAGRLMFFRVLQQGSLQAYLFYILAILVVLLIWPH